MTTELERVVRCQWIGCNKAATVKIVRANIYVCDKHHKANEAQFGCKLSTEPLDQQAPNHNSAATRPHKPEETRQ